MREFVMTLTYDRGVDPVMDTFIEYPGLLARAVDVTLTPAGLARVDRLSGPAAALDALAATYLDPSVCNECTVPRPACDAERSYDVLDEGGESRTVYSYHAAVTDCDSVPYHAAHHLPPGVVFDSWRRGDTHEWRVLVRPAAAIGEFYDAVVADLPEGVSVSVDRLSAPARWGDRTGTVADLTPAQRATIETAVERGYYETPRRVTLGDLAGALSVPQSTLRYRLRRAEAWVVETVVGGPMPAPTDRPAE